MVRGVPRAAARGVHTPIILLTAKAQEAEKVMGLELGADDYVTKPFSPRELRARIKRRAAPLRGRSAAGHVPLRRPRSGFRWRAGSARMAAPVELTALEFRLLKTFVERRGRVLSREQLIEAAWEHGTNVSDRVVDTHILNLRKKIETKPSSRASSGRARPRLPFQRRHNLTESRRRVGERSTVPRYSCGIRGLE